ncbi:hypothetical protein DUI87_10653 [Hirundo rustica rustica]|uniref:Rna-directed dna polymerase from mobile element jockey-like n=1 Tax=Hirundo rustica rustica TaxID=333673 RepID=A0A3M0KIQ8_HIRRU|nr:hypothetical protein DUI87_10653 [Hirundo rustica rustica]
MGNVDVTLEGTFKTNLLLIGRSLALKSAMRGAGVTSEDISQESVLGLVLFKIFVSDMDSGTECTLSKFANDTKLCGAVDSLEGRDVIQRNSDRFERWDCANLVTFNKVRCIWVGAIPIPNTNTVCVEKDLGVLVEEKLNMTQQCVLAAQEDSCILVYIEVERPAG